VYLAKIDITDGFYRIWLKQANILKIGIASHCIAHLAGAATIDYIPSCFTNAVGRIPTLFYGINGNRMRPGQ
jgi:uncharacterized membrane protein YjjP (DUF1212 family)